MIGIFNILMLLRLSSGNERSIKVKKNIYASFVIKGLNMGIGFILVPLTIKYLNPTKYGIWITLSSLITWISFFDVGLGNGLRNRFTEAIAKGEHELARVYISTTYAILSIIISGFLIIFYTINPFLNWGVILNAGDDLLLQAELSVLALIVFTFFCIGFVLQLITTILTADQQPAKASFFDFLSKVIALAFIFVLTKTTSGSLLHLGVVLSGSPIVVLLLSSVWFYNKRYKSYKPSLKHIDFSKSKDLLNLGVKFFFIRIAAILLYSTNNIIISHLFGPAEVTPYSIAVTYFNILMLGFTIVVSPFWSAFTEAWVKNEIEWIKKAMQKLIGFWGLLVFTGMIMLLGSKWIFSIWIGDKVIVAYSISILVVVWILITAWNGTFSQLLYAVGAIKIQSSLTLFVAIMNIPIAIYLGFKVGIEGVLITNVALAAIQMWIYPVQYKKIINKTATGIWAK